MKSKKIQIKVLGSGCPTCKKLYEMTKEVVKELDIDTKVQYITDIQKIVELGVMSSPVLAINDKVVISGRLPEKKEITAEIKKYIS